MAEKLVLAYSGGLDASIMVRWIKEKYGYDVTLTADVGQADDIAEVGKKSELIGATRHYTHASKAMQYKVAAKATAQTRKAK